MQSPELTTENFLAIDYGRKRVGLALTLSRGIAITALPVLQNHSDNFWQTIYTVIQENNIQVIIIGNPTPFDGTKSAMQNEIQNFELHLKKKFPNVLFKLWDESFTSQMAESTMILTKGEVSRFKES